MPDPIITPQVPVEQPQQVLPETEDPLAGLGRAPQTVTDPWGIPMLVPEGMDAQDVMDQMQSMIENDPKARADLMRHYQLRDLPSGDVDTNDPKIRRAHLARQVDGPVQPGDLTDLIARFDLARTELVTDKMTKLKEYLPDAELKLVNDINGEPVILFRRDGEAEYREVEAPEFSEGDVAALTAGVLSPEVLIEILLFLSTNGSSSFVKNMIKAGVGGMIGAGVDTGIERYRGFDTRGAGPVAEGIMISGITGSAGAAVFDPIARIFNGIRGTRGVITPSDSAKKAMQIAKDQNFPDLLPGQVHPMFRSMQQQAAGTTQLMEEHQLDMFQKVVSNLATIRDSIGDFRDLSDASLEGFIKKEEKKILNAMGSRSEISMETAGRQVMQGLSNFQEILAEREARAYKSAFDISKSARYNLLPAQKVVAAYRNGISDTLNLPEIKMNIGIPLTKIKNPELRSAMNELANAQSEVVLSKANASPLEQMIRLRSVFLNLSRDDRLPEIEQLAAGKVNEVLSEIMMQPRGFSGSKGRLKPSVSRAWRVAAERTKSRVRFEDKSYGRLLAGEKDPDKIAGKLNLASKNVVKETRRALTASNQNPIWGKVQNAYITKLLRDPGGINNALKGADPEVLDMLVPREYQQPLKTISHQWQRMNKGAVPKMLNSATDLGERAITLVEKGSRHELRELIQIAGGKDTPSGRALQAGVIESLLRKSTKVVQDRTVLNREKALTSIKRFRERGVLEDIFGSGTQENLIDDLETLISFLPSGMSVDAGVSMQSAAAGSGLAGFFLPTPGSVVKGLGSLHTLGKNRAVAWTFINPKVRKFFMGSGKSSKKESSPARYAMYGSMITEAFNEMEEIAESGSFNIEAEEKGLFGDFFE